MAAYAFETWDVFTDRRFAGNPLAVVASADPLTGDEMQKIAREFNLSETVFLLSPADPSNTAAVRIFTPSYEMPFAGHPTVGAALSIARARGIDGALRLELKAGVFPVRLDMKSAAPFAEFENPNPPTENGSAPPAALLEAALSLDEGAIDREGHRPRRVGAGVDFIHARASLAAVRRARLDSAAWGALDLAGVVGVVLYAEGGDAADATYHVRMFAPEAGVPEDPATGSAASALPGQIALSETLADGTHDWVVEQGVEMGRPSRIHVSVDVAGGAARKVRIGGSAAPVSSGQLLV